MDIPQPKFPEGLKTEVDKRMWARRTVEYELWMSSAKWKSVYEAFQQESRSRQGVFKAYFEIRLAEKIASKEIDSSKMDSRGVWGDLMMFDSKDRQEENYSYRAVAEIYREWALANLPKINGAEQLAAEAGEFWAGYRVRLLATYENEFLAWAKQENPDVTTLSSWLTNGALSLDGFYAGVAADGKGFDLSLFQDTHKNQTVQTIMSIKPEWSTTGSEVNTYFEANEDVRARSDWNEFLEKLEEGVLRFFETPESENMDLAVKNAVEILKRRLDGFKRAFSPDEVVKNAELFSDFIKNNPKTSDQVRFAMTELIGKTLVGGVDEKIVEAAFALTEGFEDPAHHRDLWMMYFAAVSPMDTDEARGMHRSGKKEALEKEGWYQSSEMINNSGVADFKYSLTSIERTNLVVKKLMEINRIPEALNLIKGKFGKLHITTTSDPCKGESATGEGKLEKLISKFDDPEIKMRIEREVKRGWADPMGFRSDCENLNVRAFWLELVKRGKEQDWPKEVLDALYDNAVYYDYTVGNW